MATACLLQEMRNSISEVLDLIKKAPKGIILFGFMTLPVWISILGLWALDVWLNSTSAFIYAVGISAIFLLWCYIIVLPVLKCYYPGALEIENRMNNDRLSRRI
jgi:hypothetical protein